MRWGRKLWPPLLQQRKDIYVEGDEVVARTVASTINLAEMGMIDGTDFQQFSNTVKEELSNISGHTYLPGHVPSFWDVILGMVMTACHYEIKHKLDHGEFSDNVKEYIHE